MAAIHQNESGDREEGGRLCVTHQKLACELIAEILVDEYYLEYFGLAPVINEQIDEEYDMYLI